MEFCKVIEKVVRKEKKWLIIYKNEKELTFIKIHFVAIGARKISKEEYRIDNYWFSCVCIDNLDRARGRRFEGVIVSESLKYNDMWECLIPVSTHTCYYVALDMNAIENVKETISSLCKNGYFRTPLDVADFIEEFTE